MNRILPNRFSEKVWQQRLGLVLLMAFFLPLQVFAQAGYKFRTKQSGNWSDITTWERIAITNGTTWSNLPNGANPPNQNAGQITIRPGHEVTVTVKAHADELVVEAGGILAVNDTLNIWDAGNATDMVVFGTVKNSGIIFKASTSVTIEFNANSVYKHMHTSSYGRIPVAAWDPRSTVEILGLTTPSDGAFLSTYNQEFGNLTWNTPNLGNTINLSGALAKINGNFNVISTNGKVLVLGNSTAYNNPTTAYTLTIGGNLNLLGGALNLGGTAVAFEAKLNLGGDLNIDGTGNLRSANTNTPAKIIFNGVDKKLTLANAANNTSINGASINYEVASGSSLSLASDLNVSTGRSFVVNGELQTNANVIRGGGNFVLNFGSIFGVGSPSGITSVGAAGNIQVTGIRSYGGLVTYIYNGTSPQITGDGLPTLITDLTINNNSGITLSREVTVNNLLKMNEGILKTNGNNLIVASSGNIQMPSADRISFIEGGLTHSIETTSTVTLEFPLGKNGKYRPVILEISQASSTPTTYTAEQFEGAYPTARPLPSSGSLDRVSTVRYFRITQSPAAPLNEGLVTLNYGSDDGVVDPNTLSIAKSTVAGPWMDLDGTASLGSGATAGTVVALFNEFSDFVLANKIGGNNPLPVELISFSAREKEKAVELNWATASEKNSAYFDVERSFNSRNFEAIGRMEAAGNTSVKRNYQFLDAAAKAGIVYYRLKQTDLDGTFTYSEVRSVAVTGKVNSVVFYPNPVKSMLNIEVTGTNSVIRVINTLGQEVLQRKINGASSVQLDVSSLPNGSYQLITENDQQKSVSRFMKIVQ
ncbi:T9SS type A sorting domain-containing protein [Adhaeribacter soli]|uniref:T9SS type A sorting domain-containing protein n=1 Tax=Adhaeribacter soli TaxID=2607655 RepID=A0A5N1IX38_9BACT|nr:T9SS type A sorting domain-containing protein [Adhaeribacter soli]KAA9332613.1 T9SS type A sorting domain-containing protein [Adhaeribacter soli]